MICNSYPLTDGTLEDLDENPPHVVVETFEKLPQRVKNLFWEQAVNDKRVAMEAIERLTPRSTL